MDTEEQQLDEQPYQDTQKSNNVQFQITSQDEILLTDKSLNKA